MTVFRQLRLVLGVLAILFAIGALLLLLPCIQVVKWIGSAELVLEYLVLDAVTEQPIVGAEVEVDSAFGAFPDLPKQRRRVWTTNEAGKVRYLIADNTRIGSHGAFVDTHQPYIPEWALRASGNGYVSTEWKSQLDLSQGKFVVETPSRDRVEIRFLLSKANR